MFMYLFNSIVVVCFFFFFTDTATTEIYTLSLHDALPIWGRTPVRYRIARLQPAGARICQRRLRSEEHTSELQSRVDLVCRLLLEKKKQRRDVIKENALFRKIQHLADQSLQILNVQLRTRK